MSVFADALPMPGSARRNYSGLAVAPNGDILVAEDNTDRIYRYGFS